MICDSRKTFSAGDTIKFPVRFFEREGYEKPVDVTSWTFTAAVYDDAGTTLKSLGQTTITDSMGDADWRSGWVVVAIAGSETDAIAPGNYTVRLRYTDGSGDTGTDVLLITLTNGGAS